MHCRRPDLAARVWPRGSGPAGAGTIPWADTVRQPRVHHPTDPTCDCLAAARRHRSHQATRRLSLPKSAAACTPAGQTRAGSRDLPIPRPGSRGTAHSPAAASRQSRGVRRPDSGWQLSFRAFLQTSRVRLALNSLAPRVVLVRPSARHDKFKFL